MFNTRRLLTEDYSELLEWWKWHRFPAPSIEFLPENGTCGLMVSKDKINCCAGFIYFTNSKIAWVEFIVSNPYYREPDRKESIIMLITELSNIIKNKGYKAIYTSLKNKSLMSHFERVGFVVGSVNTIEMIKKYE